MLRLPKRFLFTLALPSLALLCAGESVAEDTATGPSVGDPTPVFETVDDRGEVWNLSHHVGMTPIVIYFSPGDFKFCSIRQAQKYQQSIKELAKHDVLVVGISGDTPDTHRLFKEIHELSFTLLSDSAGDIAKQLGVPLRNGSATPITDLQGRTKRDSLGNAMKAHRGVTHSRWTIIIGRDGTILYKNTQVSPVKDCEDVLEFIKAHSVEKNEAAEGVRIRDVVLQ